MGGSFDEKFWCNLFSLIHGTAFSGGISEKEILKTCLPQIFRNFSRLTFL